ASWLMRKVLKNEIPFSQEAEKMKGDLPATEPLHPQPDDGPLGYQRRLVERAKKVLILVCDAAAQKYGAAVEDEQDILGPLSNIIQEVFVMESGLLRALKSAGTSGEQQSKTKMDMVRLYVNDAMLRIAGYAQQILTAIYTGDVLDSQLEALRKLSQFTPVNSAQLKRDIADEIIEVGRFTC
ncbi:MAG: acyl-CoA dehydrogenase, partial [Dehalococcoidia bacterium]|nr:acyl-CoA dehydrogenase [Dehalococcoidia bacterium]